MEREAELEVESWDSSMKENIGVRNGLLPGHSKSEVFKPKLLDDDGTDVSLRDWQLGLRHYIVEREPPAAPRCRPLKGSVRTRFPPIEHKVDKDMHCPRHSSPEKFGTAPTTPGSPRIGTRSRSSSPKRSEGSIDGDLFEEKLGFPNGYGLDMDKNNESCGIALPGITFGDISTVDAKSDDFRARLCRGRSLRVSSTDESEFSRSSSPPEILDRSLSRSGTANTSKDCPESATVPTIRVKPTALAVIPKEGIINADKPRGHPFPLSEFQKSLGVSVSGDRGSQFRLSSVQVTRSLESIGEGNNDDSSSNFLSGPLASSRKEDTSTSICTAPSFLLRCNARRQHDDEADEDDDENVKVGMHCGGALSDMNISGDFIRLLSKLCRLPVPLPKHCVPKPSQEREPEVTYNSIPPQVFSWDTQNSSMPSQDYVIIGRQNSLKLLAERCSSGSTPSYNVLKPRKIRDDEHHQHIYKPISKTLDEKLRS